MIHPDEWERDAVRRACTACKVPFSLLVRRHHCRHCGKIFCHDCSADYRWLQGGEQGSARPRDAGPPSLHEDPNAFMSVPPAAPRTPVTIPRTPTDAHRDLMCEVQKRAAPSSPQSDGGIKIVIEEAGVSASAWGTSSSPPCTPSTTPSSPPTQPATPANSAVMDRAYWWRSRQAKLGPNGVWWFLCRVCDACRDGCTTSSGTLTTEHLTLTSDAERGEKSIGSTTDNSKRGGTPDNQPLPPQNISHHRRRSRNPTIISPAALSSPSTSPTEGSLSVASLLELRQLALLARKPRRVCLIVLDERSSSLREGMLADGWSLLRNGDDPMEASAMSCASSGWQLSSGCGSHDGGHDGEPSSFSPHRGTSSSAAFFTTLMDALQESETAAGKVAPRHFGTPLHSHTPTSSRRHTNTNLSQGQLRRRTISMQLEVRVLAPASPAAVNPTPPTTQPGGGPLPSALPPRPDAGNLPRHITAQQVEVVAIDADLRFRSHPGRYARGLCPSGCTGTVNPYSSPVGGCCPHSTMQALQTQISQISTGVCGYLFLILRDDGSAMHAGKAETLSPHPQRLRGSSFCGGSAPDNAGTSCVSATGPSPAMASNEGSTFSGPHLKTLLRHIASCGGSTPAVAVVDFCPAHRSSTQHPHPHHLSVSAQSTPSKPVVPQRSPLRPPPIAITPPSEAPSYLRSRDSVEAAMSSVAAMSERAGVATFTTGLQVTSAGPSRRVGRVDPSEAMDGGVGTFSPVMPHQTAKTAPTPTSATAYTPKTNASDAPSRGSFERTPTNTSHTTTSSRSTNASNNSQDDAKRSNRMAAVAQTVGRALESLIVSAISKDVSHSHNMVA